MAYVTDAEFEAYLDNEIVANATWLTLAREAAEAAINDYCARHFNPPSGSPAARTYLPPCGGRVLIVHDIASTTGLTISDDGTSVPLGEVQLQPTPVSWSGEARPYWEIRRLAANWAHPSNPGERSVTVTTDQWGWATVPSKVKQATLILGKDLVHMKGTRFGVMGIDTMGAVVRVRQSQHVMMLLEGLRHPMAWGIA